MSYTKTQEEYSKIRSRLKVNSQKLDDALSALSRAVQATELRLRYRQTAAYTSVLNTQNLGLHTAEFKQSINEEEVMNPRELSVPRLPDQIDDDTLSSESDRTQYVFHDDTIISEDVAIDDVGLVSGSGISRRR